MQGYELQYFKMSEVPQELLPRLRELTFGRDTFVQWRWTFQRGECYCAILTYHGEVIAWACITHDDDWLPVVGVYTDKNWRGRGLAKSAAAHLLRRRALREGSAVFAVSSNWPRWPEVLEKAGLVHFEWD